MDQKTGSSPQIARAVIQPGRRKEGGLWGAALCAGDQVRELKRSNPHRKRNIDFAAILLVHAGPHEDVLARHAVDVAQLLRWRFLAGLGPHVVDPALALRLRQRDEFLE